jgi:hypothetical protein
VQPAALTKMQSVLEQLTPPMGTALGVALALLIIRYYAFRWLSALATRSRTRWDEFFPESLRSPTILWCVALGLVGGLEVAPLPRGLAAWWRAW